MTTSLADLTTLRIGGVPQRLVVANSRAEVIEAVAECDARGEPVLVVGGGSNLVVADEPLPATVVAMRTRGVDVADSTCAGAWVEVEAGEPWDDFVALAVREEWVGIEALSGIPGSTGATPLQNVGAYGQEVSDVVARVSVYDRQVRQQVQMPIGDCGVGYRTSVFKRTPHRYVVLGVSFQFTRGSLSAPIRYPELAQRLGVVVGDRLPSDRVREAVLQLRREKGMVLDPEDHDTWSVGSFFVNPQVPADRVPDGAPHWPQPQGTTKVSAAWLVEHAGFPRGFRLPGSCAGLSSRHSLAITNRGGATAGQVLDLARAIRSGVRERFGITLEPEPTLVGCSLD